MTVKPESQDIILPESITNGIKPIYEQTVRDPVTNTPIYNIQIFVDNSKSLGLRADATFIDENGTVRQIDATQYLKMDFLK